MKNSPFVAASLMMAANLCSAQSAPTGSQLYWLDPAPILGGIWTGPADGSTPAKKIYASGKFPDGLAVDKATRKFYFTNMTLLDSKSASVQRGDLVNGKITNVIDIVPEGWGLRTPKQLKLDIVNKKVYFADREGRRIYRAPMAGAKVKADLEVLVDFTSLPDTAHQFVGIEIDPARQEFYWSDRLTNTIWKASTRLGAPVTPANLGQVSTVITSYSTGMTCDLALDLTNRYLYWTDRGEGNELIGETLPAGFIARVPLDVPGAPIEYVLTGLLKDPVGISVDPAKGMLYFATTEDGRVFSMPISGGMAPKELHKSLLSAGVEFVKWGE